jgi:hypothetical protein
LHNLCKSKCVSEKKDLSVERTLSLICSICLLMVSAKTCSSQKEFTCLIGNVCLGLFGNCGSFGNLLKFLLDFQAGRGLCRISEISEKIQKKAQKKAQKSSERDTSQNPSKLRSEKSQANSYQIHKQTLNNSDCC